MPPSPQQLQLKSATRSTRAHHKYMSTRRRHKGGKVLGRGGFGCVVLNKNHQGYVYKLVTRLKTADDLPVKPYSKKFAATDQYKSYTPIQQKISRLLTQFLSHNVLLNREIEVSNVINTWLLRPEFSIFGPYVATIKAHQVIPLDAKISQMNYENQSRCVGHLISRIKKAESQLSSSLIVKYFNVVILKLPYIQGIELFDAFIRSADEQSIIQLRTRVQHNVLYYIKIILDTVIGLQFLHKINIIHRDIKRENIMYNETHNGTGLSTYIDFGFATQVGVDDPRYNVTADFYVMGSPGFMPPECMLVYSSQKRDELMQEFYGEIAPVYGKWVCDPVTKEPIPMYTREQILQAYVEMKNTPIGQWRNERMIKKWDVFSLGSTLYEILCTLYKYDLSMFNQDVPPSKSQLMSTDVATIKAVYMNGSTYWLIHLYGLFKMMCHPNVYSRYSIDEVAEEMGIIIRKLQTQRSISPEVMPLNINNGTTAESNIPSLSLYDSQQRSNGRSRNRNRNRNREADDVVGASNLVSTKLLYSIRTQLSQSQRMAAR